MKNHIIKRFFAFVLAGALLVNGVPVSAVEKTIETQTNSSFVQTTDEDANSEVVQTMEDSTDVEVVKTMEINPDDAGRDYPTASMTAIADSQYSGDSEYEGPADYVLYDNKDRYWHTKWGTTEAENIEKRWIGVELAETIWVDGIRCMPRQDGGLNGQVASYEIQYRKTDKEEWVTATTGEWAKEDIGWQQVSFEPVEAKYIRIVGVHTYAQKEGEKDAHMSMAELRVQQVAEDENTNYPTENNKLPIVYINTENGVKITSKVDYVNATMKIQGNDTYSDSSILYDGEIEIRGRGNSTWGMPKKPYKIKLDKKSNLFDMGKNKHWVLLANYSDESLMRNTLAYNLSGDMGMPQMETVWVDVVLNGEYVGNYQFCEQIKVDKNNRVSIFDWESFAEDAAEEIADAENFSEDDAGDLEDYMKEEDMSWITSGEVVFKENTYEISDYPEIEVPAITGGYLMELDEYYDEVSKFRTDSNQPIMFKNPEFVGTNQDMMNYVKTYIQSFENAVQSEDYTADYEGTATHYSELFDFNALVDYWLISEIFFNEEFNKKSTYMYKDIDGKVYMGPIWDMDYSSGGEGQTWQTNQWSTLYYGMNAQKDMWYKDLVKDPYFILRAQERYWEIRNTSVQNMVNSIATSYTLLKDSADANADIWYETRNFESEVNKLRNWFNTHLTWLDEQMASEDSILASLKYETANVTLAVKDSNGQALPVDNVSDKITADAMVNTGESIILTVSSQDYGKEKADIFVNGTKVGSAQMGSDFVITGEQLTVSEGEKNIIEAKVFANGKVVKNCITVLEIEASEEENPDTEEIMDVGTFLNLCDPQSLINITVTEEQAAEMRAKIAEITEGKEKEYDKAKAIFDWVANNVIYITSHESISAEPYQVFKEKRSVCGGFSNLIKEMMNLAGIPAAALSGYYGDIAANLAHQWSAVYVEGKWVYADGTAKGYFDHPSILNTHHAKEVADAVLEKDDVQLGYYHGLAIVGADSSKVVIPEDYQGHPVTSISYKLFSNSSKVEELEISKNVSYLDEQALNNLSKMKSITVAEENEVYASHEGALFTADYERMISYPEGSEHIEFTLPKETRYFCASGEFDNKEIVDLKEAFKAPKLQNIYVEEGNEFYSSYDGALYNKEGTELLCVPLGKTRIRVLDNAAISDTAFANVDRDKIVIIAKNGSPAAEYAKMYFMTWEEPKEEETEHSHKWKFNVQGMEIKAICEENDGNCPKDSEQFSLVLPSQAVYDGTRKDAVLRPEEGNQSLTQWKISYYQVKDEVVSAEESHPVTAGDYNVQISFLVNEKEDVWSTLEDTAWVFFIEKAIPQIEELPESPVVEYAPGRKLESCNLSGGKVLGADGQVLEGIWNWKHPEEVITTGTYGYEAIFTPTDEENYSIPETQMVMVEQMYVDSFFVKETEELTYTGKALKPEIQVYDGLNGKLLEKNKDYAITYKNNTNAYTLKNGEDGFEPDKAPQMIIKGKGNYGANMTVYFTIAPKDISNEDDESILVKEILLEEINKVQKKVPAITYNGKKLAGVLKPEDGSSPVKVKDFLYSYPQLQDEETKDQAFKENGTWKILVEGTGNYTGSREVEVIIAQKGGKMSSVKITKIPAQNYNQGNAVELDETTLKITGKINGTNETLKKGTHYSVEYKNNKEIGTATVIVKGIPENGFSGTKAASFKITGTSIAKTEVTGITTGEYTSEPVIQEPTVTLKKKVQDQNGEREETVVLQENTDYDIFYNQHTNAGTVKMTIVGKGAYYGTIKKTFKINQYDITGETNEKGEVKEHSLLTEENGLFTMKNGEMSLKYVKGGVKPEVKLMFNGAPLTEGKDYKVSYKNNKKVYTLKNGEPGYSASKAPTIILEGKGNFKGKIVKTFVITEKALQDQNIPVTMTVSDKAVSTKKGGYISKPVLIDADGNVLKQGTDYEAPIYTICKENGETVTLNSKDVVADIGAQITVTVVGKGAYEGGSQEEKVLTATYNITEKNFSDVKVATIQKAYTGEKVILTENDFYDKDGKSKVTIGKGNSKVYLEYGEDFEIVEGSYKNNEKKGTSSVTLQGKGLYGGTKTIQFKVGTRGFKEGLEFFLLGLFQVD